MKKLVVFVKQKIKENYTHLWLYFNGNRTLRKYEEEHQMESDKESKNLQEYYDREEKRLNELEEFRRNEMDAYWEDREEARFAKYDQQEEPDDTVENFSEHPSLVAEDEPLSPEMEYWFTPCDKCGKYPEFCPCDGKFER